MVITRDGEFSDWEDVLAWFIWITPKLRDEANKGYEDAISEPLNAVLQDIRELRDQVRPYYLNPEQAPPVNEIIPEARQMTYGLRSKIHCGEPAAPLRKRLKQRIWGLERTRRRRTNTQRRSNRKYRDISLKPVSIYPSHLPDEPARDTTLEIKRGHTRELQALCWQESKEIDAVSMVPAIEPMDNAQEGARWIFNADTLTETWQRKLDENRVRSIANFAQTSENNSIVNSIILFIPPGADGVNLDESVNELSFDFEEFLTKIDRQDRNEYRDYTLEVEGTPDKDHRPIWLLDGQHRTRGLAISERGSDLMLPIIILQGGDGPHDFSLADAAKLFTEINTLNKTLNKEMQYMLGQRFSITGSNSDNDWGDYSDDTIHSQL